MITTTAGRYHGAARRVSVPSAYRGGVAVALISIGVALLPLLQPAGPGNSSVVDAVFVLALGATLLWVGSAGLRVHIPYVVPVSILVGAGTVAGVLGASPSTSGIALLQDVGLLMWCATVANVARSEGALSTILGVWCWSAIFWAGILVLAVSFQQTGLAGITQREGTRAALTFGNPNTAATYLVISFMLLLASRRPRHVLARAAGLALIAVAIALTGSLAGIAGLAAALVVAAVVRVHQHQGAVPAAGSLFLFAIVGGLALFGANQLDLPARSRASSHPLLRDSIGRLDQSVGSRDLLVSESIDLFRSGGLHGLVGRGPAMTKTSLKSVQAPYANEAHNDFLAVLVERGVFGVVGLVLLGAGLAVRVARISSRGLSPGYASVVPRPGALAGAVVALGLSSLSHEILHFRHTWVLFGIIAALHLWGGPPERNPVRGAAA